MPDGHGQAQQVSEEQLQAAAAICARAGAEVVYLFGSHVSGKVWGESDVDLAVLLGAGVSKDRYGAIRVELIGELMSVFGSNRIRTSRVIVIILNEAPPLLTYEGVIRGGPCSTVRREFKARVKSGDELLLRARVKEGVTRIFSRTILFLLRGGPLRTVDLHPQIQRIHPDLCDDSVDRVIDGERFGKKWKHLVRTAQQILKREGWVEFDGHFWRLSEAGQK